VPLLLGVERRETTQDDLIGQILGASFEVSNELGHGFSEVVYQNALLMVLRKRGIAAQAQVPLKVRFRNVVVGEFVADIVVEDKVIVELKVVDCLLTQHQAQLINYLKATGIGIGLLINFRQARVQYRRCYRGPKTSPKS
jgi:GxxExxY protein